MFGVRAGLAEGLFDVCPLPSLGLLLPTGLLHTLSPPPELDGFAYYSVVAWLVGEGKAEGHISVALIQPKS